MRNGKLLASMLGMTLLLGCAEEIPEPPVTEVPMGPEHHYYKSNQSQDGTTEVQDAEGTTGAM